jgi:CheY-like chemotaxis protein
MNTRDPATPLILVVEADDDARPLLVAHMRRLRYRPLVALDADDALERARGGAEAPALILVNLLEPTTQQSLDTALRLRTAIDATNRIPLVVMAEEYDEAREGEDAEAGENAYVTYLASTDQLDALLARLLP